MKAIRNLCKIVTLLIILSNFSYSQENNDSLAIFARVTISVPTVKCGTCVKTVTNALKDLEGIKEVTVDRKTKMAAIKYDITKLKVADIEIAIAKSGYDANEVKHDKKAYDALDSCCR